MKVYKAMVLDTFQAFTGEIPTHFDKLFVEKSKAMVVAAMGEKGRPDRSS